MRNIEGFFNIVPPGSRTEMVLLPFDTSMPTAFNIVNGPNQIDLHGEVVIHCGFCLLGIIRTCIIAVPPA